MKDYEYVAVMFPYPSGDGLHVGHWYNYAIMDSYCRWQRRKGEKVFQPFGFDAFGLPAENYARKIGGDPREITYNNIDNFRKEMVRMNTQYEDILITSDESYYRWTQWIFTKLHEHGLAYKSHGAVNWCPSCATTLANEQVKSGKCDRCETAIESKELDQWYFKITDYKDRLIKNLDIIDFPDKTKKQQRYWLENLRDWGVSRQRKWGCPIPIEGEEDTLDTFVDSSFYYLRYLMDQDSEDFMDPEKYHQVDLYVGGNEHACMHLIYARFIHMFLYDIGVVPVEEPFKKLIHQGMITYKGEKMSKSKGNVVNPEQYDPDVLRMYLMFIGPYYDGGAWDDAKIPGIVRMLNRYKTWLNSSHIDGEELDLGSLEQSIDKNLNNWKVNLIISDLMKFYNENKGKIINIQTCEELLGMMRCFAPDFMKEK